jgi:hypothetical protein
MTLICGMFSTFDSHSRVEQGLNRWRSYSVTPGKWLKFLRQNNSLKRR